MKRSDKQNSIPPPPRKPYRLTDEELKALRRDARENLAWLQEERKKDSL